MASQSARHPISSVRSEPGVTALSTGNTIGTNAYANEGFSINLGTSSADEGFALRSYRANATAGVGGYTWNEAYAAQGVLADGTVVAAGAGGSWEYDVMFALNTLGLNQANSPDFYPDSVFVDLPDDWTTFANVQDFVDYVRDHTVYRFVDQFKQVGDTETYPDWEFTFENGVLSMRIQDLASDYPYQINSFLSVFDLGELYSTAPDLNLSTDEFGLVTSGQSGLSSDALQDAAAVAAVLSEVFDLSASTDNGELNTTVFAVTAADDPNVTAVWAHLQSSTGDSTVDAHELSLLATVNTLGEEFALANFLPQPVIPV